MPDNYNTYPPISANPLPGSSPIPPPTPPPIVGAPSTPTPTAPAASNFKPPRRIKTSLLVLGLLLVSVTLPAAVFLAKQSQDTRKQAVNYCKKADGTNGQQCDDTDHCDIDGNCNPACCGSNDDCSATNHEQCGPSGSNGYCKTTRSCIAEACKNNGAACAANWQCCSAACSGGKCTGETKTCNSCAEMGAGFTDDPTCYAGGQACKLPPQNGFCCKKPDNTSVCCYSNCECYEGQQNNCLDKGSGKIWLKAGITVSKIYKMTGSNVACPFSISNQTNLKENYIVKNVTDGGEEFSLGSNECGQIEAVGYCGSCKPGCSIAPPTSTPVPTVTSAITPTITQGVTPTIGPLACASLTGGTSPQTKKAGDTVTLSCHGTADSRAPINHFEFRVSISNATAISLPNAAAQATTPSGSYLGTYNYVIPTPGYGCYKFDCRACTSTDSTNCTAWGLAK